MDLIFKCYLGSHLYGTNTPTSDLDFGGIFMPTKEMLFGLQNTEECNEGTKTNSDRKNTSDDIDFKIYNLKTFVQLALKATPNILEYFFIPKDKTIIETPEFTQFKNNSNLFLSKKILDSFMGYSLAQEKLGHTKTKRYTTLVNLQQYLSSLKDMNIQKFNESHIEEMRKLSDGWKNDRGDLHVFHISQHVEQVKNQVERELNEYGHRKQNIIKYGFETKFFSHIIRLLDEGIQLAETGKIVFPLEKADIILKCKKGEITLEECSEVIADLKEKFRKAELKTTMPNKPNYGKVNSMMIDIIENFHFGKKINNIISKE